MMALFNVKGLFANGVELLKGGFSVEKEESMMALFNARGYFLKEE